MISLLAVEFNDTVNLGSIFVVVGAAALALLFTLRSHMVATWRSNYEAQKIRADEEREQKHVALSKLAALELTRDLTPLIASQQELIAKVVAMQEEGEARYGMALAEVRQLFDAHEQRALERHESQLDVMSEITKTLKAMHTNGQRGDRR